MISNNKIYNSYIIESEDINFAKEEIQKFIISLGFDENLVMSYNHPDVKYIESVNQTILVDDIRKMLVNDIIVKPRIGSKKVYIIYDAKYMTESTQNAILKTIEEPPEYAIIFLITKNKNSLLETIKSRCYIENLSKKNSSYQELKDKEYFQSTLKIVSDSAFNSLKEINEYAEYFSKNKEETKNALYIMRIFIRDCLLYIDNYDKDVLELPEDEIYCQSLINKYTKEELGLFVDIIDEADNEIKSNIDTQTVMIKTLMLFRKRGKNG